MITRFTQRTPELLAAEVVRSQDTTDRPFGVNLTSLLTFREQRRCTAAGCCTSRPYAEYTAAIADGVVTVVETAGRSPEKHMPALKAAGITFLQTCTPVRRALKAESIGCDAVSIDGFACGGQPG